VQKIVVCVSSTAASVIVTPNSMVRMIVSATTDGGQAVASDNGLLGGVGEAWCRNPHRHPPRPRLSSPTRHPHANTRTHRCTLVHEEPDNSKPLWLNLGYWKVARTYPDACVAMVELLGTRAALQPSDGVLDVGVGFAEQDFVLLDRFKVSHITGIDITPVHVDKGRERVAKRGLEKQIDIRLGSATAMEFPDASFEKVLALECAFHFDTRDQFMREAFRVLKPGGTIALTDMLPNPGKKPGLTTVFGRKYGHSPEANYYDREEYSRRLSAAGFGDVLVESIREDVFPGMAKYSRQRIGGKKKMDKVVGEVTEYDRAQCRGVEMCERGTGLTDYVIVSARKPLDTRLS
jgi:microcystin synthetase protein McyJ